jgi:hypothetical protein
MPVPYLTFTEKGIRLKIRLTPKSSKEAIEGLHGDALKVKVKAPPVDGKANKALVKCLARRLGVTTAEIEITSGLTSRNKVVLVHGLSPEEMAKRLEL